MSQSRIVLTEKNIRFLNKTKDHKIFVENKETEIPFLNFLNVIENVIRRKITLVLVIKPFDQDLLTSTEKSSMYLFLINFERDTKSNPNL